MSPEATDQKKSWASNTTFVVVSALVAVFGSIIGMQLIAELALHQIRPSSASSLPSSSLECHWAGSASFETCTRKI
jgi:hypothetical protein